MRGLVYSDEGSGGVEVRLRERLQVLEGLGHGELCPSSEMGGFGGVQMM